MSDPTDAERLIREARDAARQSNDNNYSYFIARMANALEAALAETRALREVGGDFKGQIEELTVKLRVAVEARELAGRTMTSSNDLDYRNAIAQIAKMLSTLSAPTGDKVK